MIINIYKPKNWTSFDIVAKLRGILKIRKIGHAGTLDPLAEGVLVILTEKDTKRQAQFSMYEKEYKARIAFGIDSPTYDLEGPITLTGILPNKNEILNLIPNFLGEIKQEVPPYSAVKVGGKKLYNLARKGQIHKVTLPYKLVTVYSIDINSFEEEEIDIHGDILKLPVLECTITCSSGTYIRSLAHDLGGVLVGLVRTKVGPYTLEDSVMVEELQPKIS